LLDKPTHLQAHLLFLQHTNQRKIKSKEPANQLTKTSIKCAATGRPRKNNEPLTAPKKNGGGSANTNICATNKV